MSWLIAALAGVVAAYCVERFIKLERAHAETRRQLTAVLKIIGGHSPEEPLDMERLKLRLYVLGVLAEELRKRDEADASWVYRFSQHLVEQNEPPEDLDETTRVLDPARRTHRRK